MKRLLLLASAVALVWVALAFHPTAGRDPLDTAILLGIGVTFLIAGVVMLLYTRDWSLRGLGLLAVVFGDAVLYATSGVLRLLTIPAGPREGLVDVSRALFIVGAPLLLFGLIRWVWGGPDEPAPPEIGE